MIAGAVPAPSASTSSAAPRDEQATAPRDEQATSVLDGDELSAAQTPSASRSAAPRPRPVVSDDDLARGDDAYAKARRPRWVAPLVAGLLLGAGGVFVATHPQGGVLIRRDLGLHSGEQLEGLGFGEHMSAVGLSCPRLPRLEGGIVG